MDTYQFSKLRAKAGMTQSAVADALQISTRTISAWESSKPLKELSLVETHAIRALFRDKILEKQLQAMCERAFKSIPSEYVAIWLVERLDCILLPGGSRLQDLKNGVKRQTFSPIIISPLNIESLTTYPLRGGEILNLAGDFISNHPKKKNKGNRVSQILQSHICESLLHMPGFTASARGPLPVMLLCLENKIDDKNSVIIPGQKEKKIFSEADVGKAQDLANEFTKKLLEDLVCLDMIELQK